MTRAATRPTNGLAGDPFNYIRNSVKVVMDAYDGDMSFYVSDQTDPIIKAWEGVFPNLFKPMSDMPADLKGDATATRATCATRRTCSTPRRRSSPSTT
jgi:uncharacterized membrane protein (UPF0182 family)